MVAALLTATTEARLRWKYFQREKFQPVINHEVRINIFSNIQWFKNFVPRCLFLGNYCRICSSKQHFYAKLRKFRFQSQVLDPTRTGAGKVYPSVEYFGSSPKKSAQIGAKLRVAPGRHLWWRYVGGAAGRRPKGMIWKTITDFYVEMM